MVLYWSEEAVKKTVKNIEIVIFRLAQLNRVYYQFVLFLVIRLDLLWAMCTRAKELLMKVEKTYQCF